MDFITKNLILLSGRSWWQAHYSDGRILAEWETTQGKYDKQGNSSSSRWEDIPKDNMIALELLCPNGEAGGLKASEGHKFFQLKSAKISVGSNSECVSHIIGVVINDKGDCLCRAWESREKRLIEFSDNVLNFQYYHIGLLSFDVQGLRI